MEPGLNQDARNLLYRARAFKSRASGFYPLALESDKQAAPLAIASGYIARKEGDPHLVTMTAKGEAYLDRLMRCE